MQILHELSQAHYVVAIAYGNRMHRTVPEVWQGSRYGIIIITHRNLPCTRTIHLVSLHQFAGVVC